MRSGSSKRGLQLPLIKSQISTPQVVIGLSAQPGYDSRMMGTWLATPSTPDVQIRATTTDVNGASLEPTRWYDGGKCYDALGIAAVPAERLETQVDLTAAYRTISDMRV